MYEAIRELMIACNVNEIDFSDKLDEIDRPYVIWSTDGAASTQEVRVDKIRMHDGHIEVMDQDGYDDTCWRSIMFGSDVITCSIDDLYDQVHAYLRHFMSNTYVYLLEFSTTTLRIIRLTNKEAEKAASYDDFESYLSTLEDKYSFDLSNCQFMVSDGLKIDTVNFKYDN